MPYPNKGEKKQAYISRCISYLIDKEGKTQEQAAGQCYGMWEQKKPKKKVRIVKRKKV